MRFNWSAMLGGLVGGVVTAVVAGMVVARYLPELVPAVLAGELDASAVFDLELPLEQAPEAYAAMDERRAIKVLLRP